MGRVALAGGGQPAGTGQRWEDQWCGLCVVRGWRSRGDSWLMEEVEWGVVGGDVSGGA